MFLASLISSACLIAPRMVDLALRNASALGVLSVTSAKIRLAIDKLHLLLMIDIACPSLGLRVMGRVGNLFLNFRVVVV
jgi:hypothetical protein